MNKIIFLFLPVLLCNKILYAQTGNNIISRNNTLQNITAESDSLVSQTDVPDVFNNLFHKKNQFCQDRTKMGKGRYRNICLEKD